MGSDQIYAVTIWDRTVDGQFLTFDLSDLLLLAGERARRSDWLCLGVEAVGDAADQLQAISDSKKSIDGHTLFKIAEGIDQTIDGDFEARLIPSGEPWLVIRSIRGDEFVVTTREIRVIEAIRGWFSDVRDSPPDADYLRRRSF